MKEQKKVRIMKSCRHNKYQVSCGICFKRWMKQILKEEKDALDKERKSKTVRACVR